MEHAKVVLTLGLALFLTTCSSQVQEEVATPKANLDFVWYEDEFVKFQYPESFDVEVDSGHFVNTSDENENGLPPHSDYEGVNEIILKNSDITLSLSLAITDHLPLENVYHYSTENPFQLRFEDFSKPDELTLTLEELPSVLPVTDDLYLLSFKDKTRQVLLLEKEKIESSYDVYYGYANEIALSNPPILPFSGDYNGYSLEEFSSLNVGMYSVLRVEISDAANLADVAEIASTILASIARPLKSDEVGVTNDQVSLARFNYVWYEDELIKFQYPEGYSTYVTPLSEIYWREAVPSPLPPGMEDRVVDFGTASKKYHFRYSSFMEGMDVGTFYSYEEGEGLKKHNPYFPSASFEAYEGDYLIEQVGSDELGLYFLFPDIQKNGVFTESNLENDVILMSKDEDIYLGRGAVLFFDKGLDSEYLFFNCQIGSMNDVLDCTDIANHFLNSAIDQKSEASFFEGLKMNTSLLGPDYVDFGPIPQDLQSAADEVIATLESRDLEHLNELLSITGLRVSPVYKFAFSDVVPISSFAKDDVYHWGSDRSLYQFDSTFDEYLDRFSLKGDEWERAHVSFNDSRAENLLKEDGKGENDTLSLEYFLDPSDSNGEDWKAVRFFFLNENGAWKLSIMAYADQEQVIYQAL